MKMIKAHQLLMASLIAALSVVTLLHAEDANNANNAVTRHGATFEQHIVVDDVTLTLSGVGVLKLHGIVKLYVAGLYVDMNAPNFENAAKRLDVHYLVSAKAKRFNSAGERILRSSLGDDGFARIKDRYHQFGDLYPDSRRGDRCSVFWQMGTPIELVYNGDALGTAAGDDFAKGYLDIWLGTAPADVRLRNDLRKEADKRWSGVKE